MFYNSLKGLAVIISSPSGAGKTTIAKEILRRISNSKLSISCTTRKARKDEIHGKDYYFLTKKKFLFLKKKKSFIETAKVYHHFYGTLKKEVFNNLNKNKIVILDVDWQGAESIKKILKINCILFYLVPPSLKELRKRLLYRHKEDTRTALLRFSNAKTDLKKVVDYDYVVVNNKFQTCVNKIINFITYEKKKIKEKISIYKKINLMVN